MPPKRSTKSSTPRRTEAYVDTGALIAFADRSDTHHSLFRALFADPPALVTTPLVIAEGQGWFLRRFDPTRALHFLAMIEAMAPLEVLAVGQPEVAGATAILRRFPDQDLTFVDAVGLHVMQARGIAACWSPDRHLTLLGASLAIHEV